MLLEIHMLQNHAPSNLNRDDTGSPKDCIFGGIRRSRVSSQCLKRSIRTSPVFEEVMNGIDLGVRTRNLPALVKDALVKDGIDEEVATAAANKVSGFGNKDGKETSNLKTAQIMFFSQPEIDGVIKLMKGVVEKEKTKDKIEKLKAKDLQTDLKTLFEEDGIVPVTPDVALFGRMITSKAFNDIEASMQVAHALSTNKMDHEFDFFTAVDDIKGLSEEMEDQGAGMMGDIEFNSACYYKYFSLDVDGFLETLAGGGEVTSDHVGVLKATVSAFLKGAVFTTPTGKQNTFAAHQLPDLVLVEMRDKKTPVSYANAFLKPCSPSRGQDLVETSIASLASHVNTITEKFGLDAAHRFLFATKEDVGLEGVESCATIDELVTNVTGHLSAGEQ